ncbi:MAG: twin-arginine translocation signal domain-containing protein [Planctomycetaceae bacterium]|nr:twin-arginine translocation signal domain-containing protein [Planctomycetaceae bacterium]
MKRETRLWQQPAGAGSRRDFLKRCGTLTAGVAVAGMAIPRVHAAEDNTIRLALIGCGGRGSGAVINAFESPNGPCKLVAMADIFGERMEASYKALAQLHPDKLDVPPDRRFVGFDAYKKAIDCLRPGVDIAMLTTYPAFRPVHLDYAVSKGVNVFMEKSFAVDPVGVRRVVKAGEEATKKNLKIAAGLMCRHSVNRQELIKRIHDDELGPVQLIRAYRMEPCGGMSPKRPADMKELLWQIRNRTHILWVSGGLWAEMDIHQIDEICWLKDDHYPVSAHGVCGRTAVSKDAGQGFDSFTVEYTFDDGAKAYDVVRYIPNCYTEFATFVHGTKRAAQFSGAVHAGACHIYRDQRCAPVKISARYDRASGQYVYTEEARTNREDILWRAPKENYTCWQAEWNVLLDSIRKDRPQNEAQRAAYSNLTGLMGRAAMHMGQVITWDQMLQSNFELCPNIDTMTEDSPPPVMPDADGYYPAPVPGKWVEV